jgi:hypothetical protein
MSDGLSHQSPKTVAEYLGDANKAWRGVAS